MSIQHVLHFVGSPKARHSTSEALGRHVTDRMASAGVTVSLAYSHHIHRGQAAEARFLRDFDSADLLLVTYPLYVDTLPYLVVQAFERLAAHRAAHPTSRRQRLACIGNCGFPEAKHLALSIAVCEEFAGEAELAWYGGLSIGEGAMLHGAPPATMSRPLRNQIKALDMMADALLRDEPIPTRAVELAARPAISPRLYTLMGTLGWRQRARMAGAKTRLDNRPYGT